MAALTMTVGLDLHVLELLTARLCHELSGPIGAVGNGVELLAEDDADFARDALTLVQDNVRRAANRLRFYRFCYGFGGDAATAGPAPCELAAELLEGAPIVCDYADSVRALPLDRQKLGCNLLLVGAEALVRGGRLVLDATFTGLQLEVTGESASLAPEQAAALRLETPVGALNSRTVQAYFSGLLARARGARLVAATSGPGGFRISSIESAV
jgi:histidine phosphotransferase ChpT